MLAEPRLVVRGLDTGDALTGCGRSTAMVAFGDALGVMWRLGFFDGVDCGDAILADFLCVLRRPFDVALPLLIPRAKSTSGWLETESLLFPLVVEESEVRPAC